MVRRFLLAVALGTVAAWLQAAPAPATDSSSQATAVADTPFAQQYHCRHVLAGGAAANDVRAVAVDPDGSVWAATRAGVYRLEKGGKQWSSLLPRAAAGPSFGLAVDGKGTVWVGAWNGLYRSGPKGLVKIAPISAPISTICIDQESVVALGPKGCWRVRADLAAKEPISCMQSIRAAMPNSEGGLWIATQMGLYHHAGSGQTSGYWKREQLVSADVRGIAYAADGALWVGSLGGITLFDRTDRVRQFTGPEGLANVDLRCLRRGPDGRMWVGSSLGVSIHDGNSWSLRHGRRWLVGDQVRDIAFDQDATAWIATNAGVSAIAQKSITLAEKAAHYDRICQARHVRPPGLVEKCRLATPGDTTTWEPYDDDNDGQYTSIYLAMESLRYAATKDPRAKANARRAFDALQFLQTVTDTPGFVARTVVPSDWTRMHDPNRQFSDPQWADRLVGDPRDKRVEVRWHRSADGRWLWKGDTSSDEITGHYFGYLYYYDLVADEAERERVGNHVRKVTDAIVDSGYQLRGMDGTPTRWGVWAPEKLNHDPNWAMERNVNSVEILSYLKAAFHMTGDEKYQRCYLDLIRNHGYAENARQGKPMGPAWRTHIDDELLALAYPALMKYETDPALRAIYRQSLDHWYRATREDRNPFANFTYSGLTGKCLDLEASLAFLRDAPLDLVRWRVDNSTRSDIRLTNLPEMEMVQTSRLLPPSEIGFFRWDRNPWQAVQGDGGHTESDGVFWLLPYWMGRHQELIQP
jgi:hypothetical protein